MSNQGKITIETIREDFDDPRAVIHYTRAAHRLGLWKSEQILIDRFIPEKSTRILEAGTGAGRVSMALWAQGYRDITAFDLSGELLEQARSLASERRADITFFHADATKLDKSPLAELPPFDAILFMFNGLMQIPLRRNRRRALRHFHKLGKPGATLLFTTHDRDEGTLEKKLWKLELIRWAQGKQDPRIREFGDRYFEDEEIGRTFMHLPSREEILEDLRATGWNYHYDAFRTEIARESKAILDFSDECRFWLAYKT